MDTQKEHEKGKITRKELKEYLDRINDYADTLNTILEDTGNWDVTDENDENTDISSNPIPPPPPPPGH